VGRRSWIAQSAHRTGGGPHADRRERRSCSTRRQLREREITSQLDAADLDAEDASKNLSTHLLTPV